MFVRILTLVVVALTSIATPIVLCVVSPASAVTGIINDDGVDVGDEWTSPGAGGSPGDDGSSGAGGGGWLGPYRPGVPWAIAHAYCVALVVPPDWCATLEPEDPTPEIPALPDLTLSDVAHVEPQSPTLSTQPSGWSVVGVETNLIAHIQTHSAFTTVHERDVEVRFTPIHYEWVFGDGQTAATDVPGAPWSVLGVPEFARTATSHRYVSATPVVPHVDVTYSVDYRWPAHDWVDINGTLTRGADAPVIFIQNADTVLVTGPCTPAARAPGPSARPSSGTPVGCG